MWYPTKPQWFVIWFATVLCVIAFLATDPQPESFVMPSAAVTGLFLWQISSDPKKD